MHARIVLYVAIAFVTLALAGVVGIVAWRGFDDDSTPIALTIMTSIGTLVAVLATAVRADHAATHSRETSVQVQRVEDKADKLEQAAGVAASSAVRSAAVAQLTASKLAVLEQLFSTDSAKHHLCHDVTCTRNGT